MPGIFRVNSASIPIWNWRYVLQIQVVGNPQRRTQRLKIWSRAWKNLNSIVFSIVMAIISGVQWDNRPVPLLLVWQPQLVQHEADDQREEERSPQVQWPPLLWHLRPPQVWADPPFFYQCMEKNTPRKIVTQSILSGYLEKLVKVIWYWPKCWLSDFILSMLLKFFCKLCVQFVTICVASRPKCFFSHVTLISNQFILA